MKSFIEPKQLQVVKTTLIFEIIQVSLISTTFLIGFRTLVIDNSNP